MFSGHQLNIYITLIKIIANPTFLNFVNVFSYSQLNYFEQNPVYSYVFE